MKHSASNFNKALQDLIRKIFFCSQLIIISLALPLLYYVSISYNIDTTQKNKDVQKHVIMTNKGKKLLVLDKTETNETIKYIRTL